MAILALSGYAKSGKNTVATIIQYLMCDDHHASLEEVLQNYSKHKWWLEKYSKWEQKSFAGKLKEIASILTSIPYEKFDDQNFKLTTLGQKWSNHGMPMTVREFLQKLGTDGLRNGLHPNTWVNALMSDYFCTTCGFEDYKEEGFEGCSDHRFPNWIITDCRFINEATVIKKAEAKIIRINRIDVGPINNHISEIGMDNYVYDYVINNDSDLVNLTIQIKNILQKENII